VGVTKGVRGYVCTSCETSYTNHGLRGCSLKWVLCSVFCARARGGAVFRCISRCECVCVCALYTSSPPPSPRGAQRSAYVHIDPLNITVQKLTCHWWCPPCLIRRYRVVLVYSRINSQAKKKTYYLKRSLPAVPYRAVRGGPCPRRAAGRARGPAARGAADRPATPRARRRTAHLKRKPI
jgi:hypothetical protein